MIHEGRLLNRLSAPGFEDSRFSENKISMPRRSSPWLEVAEGTSINLSLTRQWMKSCLLLPLCSRCFRSQPGIFVHQPKMWFLRRTVSTSTIFAASVLSVSLSSATLSLLDEANSTIYSDGSSRNLGVHSGYQCHGAYGHRLSKISCLNAWEKIGFSKEMRLFSPRASTHPTATPMPVRYLSDDGVCAIDLNLRLATSVVTSEESISEQARSIMEQCVVAQRVGGSFHNASKTLIGPHLRKQLAFNVFTVYIRWHDCGHQELRAICRL